MPSQRCADCQVSRAPDALGAPLGPLALAANHGPRCAWTRPWFARRRICQALATLTWLSRVVCVIVGIHNNIPTVSNPGLPAKSPSHGAYHWLLASLGSGHNGGGLYRLRPTSLAVVIICLKLNRVPLPTYPESSLRKIESRI
ncbi:hypothetical protein BDV12DRAFT_6958 [Aspergillus spectabilis]